MDGKDLFRRRLSLVVVGFFAVIALIYIGDSRSTVGILRSNAQINPSYTAVLAKIQQATTSDAINALARGAGLGVSSSSQNYALERDTEFLITDPQSGAVLAAAMEYDDFALPATTTVPVATSSIPTSTAIAPPITITINGTSTPNPSSSPAPTVSINASVGPPSGSPPASIQNDELYLTWNTQNASSCSATGPFFGSAGDPYFPLTSAPGFLLIGYPSTYTITCIGSGGTVTATANIGANGSVSTSTSQTPTAPVPTVSISGALSSSGTENILTLTWSSANATSCTASGAWSGSKALSGTSAQSVGSIALETFTITCTGPGGGANASVQVQGPHAPTGNSKLIIPTGTFNFNDLLHIPIACAQSTGGGLTVIGNNTGQMAECAIAGSNGTAVVLVYPNGQIYGVGGNANYNFSINDVGVPAAFVDELNTYANAGINFFQSIEGAPTVLASDSNNQITAVIDESAISNTAYNGSVDGTPADGVALSVSTAQPSGTFHNTCTANLFVANAADDLNYLNLGGKQTILYTNIITHEIAHCLGLGHTTDPSNLMYAPPDGTPLSAIVTAFTGKATNLLTLNPAQIQYLKDRRAGNTIQVDPNSCTPACPAGSGIINNSPSQGSSQQCVSQQDLCGSTSTPNSVWNEQAQGCVSCPFDTYADLDTGSCVPYGQNIGGCAPDLITSECIDYLGGGCSADQLENGWVNNATGGCEWPYAVVTSTICGSAGYPDCPTSAAATCLDNNNNRYPCASTNCGAVGQLACPITVPAGTCLDANGTQYSCAKTKKTKAASITLTDQTGDASDLVVGATDQLVATINPTNVNTPVVAWASSDETVATVDQTGLVTAIALGTADITASFTDGSNITSNAIAISTTGDYCSENPTDPDCVNYCASNPTDSSCIGIDNSVNDPNYCTEYPNDPSCIGVNNSNNLNDCALNPLSSICLLCASDPAIQECLSLTP